MKLNSYIIIGIITLMMIMPVVSASIDFVNISSARNLDFIVPSNSVIFTCYGNNTGGTTISNVSLWSNVSGTWTVNKTKLTGETLLAGPTYSESSTGAGSNGVKIRVNENNITLTKVSKASMSTATIFRLRNSTFDEVFNASFVGDTAEVNYELETGKYYYLLGDKGGLTYESGYNSTATNTWKNHSQLNFTSGYSGGDVPAQAFVIYSVEVAVKNSSSTNDFNVSLTTPSSWACEDCSSGGDCLFSSQNISWDYKVLQNSQTYDSTTIEGEPTTFTINISLSYGQVLNTANLYYNNTAYPAGISSVGGNYILTKTITTPDVVSSEKYPFKWSFNLASGQVNTTETNQTVTTIVPLTIATSCASGYLPAMNFTFQIENNFTSSNADIDYVFTYGITNNSLATINSSLTNVASFLICINSSQDYYNIGYGQIDYQITGFEKRSFFVFNGQRITNQTIFNILYLIESTSSTPVLFTAQSTSLNPYSNHYMSLLRYYPELDSYKIVDMGKTDDKGQTVLKVKTTDVDYRVGVYTLNGTLVKLINPIRMVCLTTPCTYSIYIEDVGIDMSNFLNIQKSLTWNNNTKTFTFIWNDPSQATTLMNLTVWKITGSSEDIICSTSASSFTGVLSCDISTYTGSFRADVYRSASPPLRISQLFSSIVSTIINIAGGGGKTVALVIGLIFVALMGLIGLFNPIVAVIMSILGLIPLFLLGGINLAVLTGVIVLGFTIIHFLRRTTG